MVVFAFLQLELTDTERQCPPVYTAIFGLTVRMDFDPHNVFRGTDGDVLRRDNIIMHKTHSQHEEKLTVTTIELCALLLSQ